MVDPKTTEASLEFYEKTKAYFVENEKLDCVIEISDGPIETWVRHYPKTEREMILKRRELWTSNKLFIAIGWEEQSRYFFFTDINISKTENLTTNEVTYFDVKKLREINHAQIRQEFLALKKLLQGA